MRDPVTFQQFAAASPYTDPVDRKKLLFIYRAVEDFAAERRMSPSAFRFLEVGSGQGGIALPLARLGSRVRAVDIDTDKVAALESIANASGFNNLHITVEDASGFRDVEPYEVVVASEVIDHVLDPDALLSNITRHMTPGGLLIVTTPNGYGPWELSNYVRPRQIARRWNWLRRAAGKKPYVAGTGLDHRQHFTRSRLLKMFHRHGLEVQRFGNSDFVLAISKRTRRHQLLGQFDAGFADVVPHWLASGWYVALRLHHSSRTSERA